MKILTKEEEQAHYNATVKGGLLGGAVGLGIGSLAVWGASQRFPTFRHLTPQFRVFLGMSVGIFSSIIAADRASRTYELERNPQKQFTDQSSTLQQQLEREKGTLERAKDWAKENRYGIVFGSWVASMGIALGLVGRNPYLTSQQKLVQARVYAQGLTVAVLVASFAVEANDANKGQGRWETVKIIDPNDPTHKHVIEKKIHHERYAGEDQWRDMVEAEERKMQERERYVKEHEGKDKKAGKHGKSQDEKEQKHSKTSDKP